MKTNPIVHSSAFTCLLLCVTWFTLVGSSYAGTWVPLRTDMKGSHTPHSGSDSKEVHQRWLEIELSGVGLKQNSQIRLEWVLYADDLDEDKVVEQAKGTEIVELAVGKTATVKTKETVFEYVRQHSERQGSGRKARFKLLKASGHRYHGWAVRAFSADALVGEAFSGGSLRNIDPLRPLSSDAP
jgi:hypothetical protein